MPELAYLNGRISAIEDAFVSVEDRGYQFADAVYEVIPSHNGRMFRAEEHIKRMIISLNALGFPDISAGDILKEVNSFFDKGELKRASVYIQISRGVYRRDHILPDIKDTKIQIVMILRNIPDYAAEKREKGISTITVKDIRWGRCDIKTVQLLPNSLAKRKALEAGADDAIFVSDDGIVREASSSNIFIVKDGTVFTHPKTFNILSGVTRSEIIDICSEADIFFTERFYTLQELIDADEVFLTGSITEVLPVVLVNGSKIGAGIPGEITKRLYLLLWERMTE